MTTLITLLLFTSAAVAEFEHLTRIKSIDCVVVTDSCGGPKAVNEKFRDEYKNAIGCDGPMFVTGGLYLHQKLIADEGDFSPTLLNLPEIPGQLNANAIYSAVEQSIAVSEVFSLMWREAIGYSEERTLLGYDHHALAEYYLEQKLR